MYRELAALIAISVTVSMMRVACSLWDMRFDLRNLNYCSSSSILDRILLLLVSLSDSLSKEWTSAGTAFWSSRVLVGDKVVGEECTSEDSEVGEWTISWYWMEGTEIWRKAEEKSRMSTIGPSEKWVRKGSCLKKYKVIEVSVRISRRFGLFSDDDIKWEKKWSLDDKDDVIWKIGIKMWWLKLYCFRSTSKSEELRRT